MAVESLKKERSQQNRTNVLVLKRLAQIKQI